MDLPRTADIVIIGGGVMGASIAYHLAVRGNNKILLIEKEDFFGTGATGRCAGGVRYQFSTEINIRLSLKSLPMLERFEDEIGQPINYRHSGYLILLTDQDDLAEFQHNVSLQNRLGVTTEWLDGEQIRSLLPMINLDDVLAGTFHARDGIVDPNSVVMGYIKAANRQGAATFAGVEVTGIVVNQGRITSVETSAGNIDTP